MFITEIRKAKESEKRIALNIRIAMNSYNEVFIE
jgi:hypothetical protein